MKKTTVFSPKETWIKAQVIGAGMKSGQLTLHVECYHHEVAEFVSARPYLFEDLAKTECWAKGIINSSGNILVKLPDGGFAPIGRETSKSNLVYGVSVFTAANDLSRDTPPEYIKSRVEADKLCLLAQVVSCRGWTVADIAKNSGLDLSRIKGANLQTLLRAVLGEMTRQITALTMPKLGSAVLKMIV